MTALTVSNAYDKALEALDDAQSRVVSAEVDVQTAELAVRAAEDALGRAERTLDAARDELAEAEQEAEDAESAISLYDKIGCTGGAYLCDTCRHKYLGGGTTYLYSPDCPNRPHGYDPIARNKAGRPESDLLCKSWKPDRHWYYAITTPQAARDAVPGHLKP